MQLALQLARLGIFNPKQLEHEELGKLNYEQVSRTKTSTWISKENIILITQVPKKFKKVKSYRLIGYPNKQKLQLNVDVNFYKKENGIG